MNCDRFRSDLSARFDGELEAEALARHERHAASCPACAEDWADFERSTRALRGLEVPPLGEEGLDSIVAAALVAGATPEPASRSGAWIGHGLSLLAGAALVLLFLGLRGEGAPGGSVEDSDASPVPSGRWTLDALPLTPRAGERLRVEPGALLSYHGPDGRRIDIEGQPALELPPRVEVVERVVERVELVPLPAEGPAPQELARLEEALTFLGEACLRLAEAPIRPGISPGVAAVPGASHAESVESPVRPQPRPDRTTATDRPAVVVQRDGESLILETRGSLDEVVPALIGHFGEQDPQVSRLVERRLREIWAEETGGDLDDAPIAFEPDEDEVRDRFGWRRWIVSEGASEEEALDPATLWSRWWRDHRGSGWVSAL